MKPLSLAAWAAICMTSVLTSCHENFDKRLEREAREFTENRCPQEPEPETRLDSTTYHPEQHVYTLWYSLAAANEAAMREQTALMHRLLVRELVGDVNYKMLKDEGITFRYVYRSQATGAVVYDTQVKAEEYRVH